MIIKIAKTGSVFSLILLVLFSILSLSGYSLNLTKSYPRGLYKGTQFSLLKTAKGKLVLVCADPHNPVIKLADNEKILPHGSRCPNTNIAPFLKRLVGIPGDHVSISDSGIEINGQLQNNSTLEFPFFSRLIHLGDKITLGQNECWIMSEYNNESFDSRYFGVIQTQQIIEIVKPVCTL